MTIREEIAKSDSYDALLMRLSGQPEVQAIAAQWRLLRASSGMSVVRPFDGADASAEATFFLLEVMLRLEKLREELAVVAREGAGKPMDISILMAQNEVRQADLVSKTLAEVLVRAHTASHQVGATVG